MQAKLQKPSWFDLKKYGHARTIGFQEWAVQIGNRFYLGTLLDASKLTAAQLNAKRVELGMPEVTELEANDSAVTHLKQFDVLFKQLQTNPFADLGFKASYPSDKTIHPLTFGVAKTIVKALSDVDCSDKDYCDDKLRDLHPEIFGMQAHLFVDLRAPEPLLKEQFGEWIKEVAIQRERGAITESVLQTWSVSYPILPYQDLRLWYSRQLGRIPSDGEFACAHWFMSGANKDTIRPIRDWADRAFTMNCYHDLVQSASRSSKPSTA